MEQREPEAQRKAETLAALSQQGRDREVPTKPPKPLPVPGSHGHARSQSAPRPPPKPEARPETRTTRVGKIAFQVSKPGAERNERKAGSPRAKEPQRASSVAGFVGRVKSTLSKTTGALSAATSNLRDSIGVADVDESAKPATVISISAPTRAKHVGHLGWDAESGTFEARNLPPEWQTMFSGLNRTLRSMGVDELSETEARFLLSTVKLEAAVPSPPAGANTVKMGTSTPLPQPPSRPAPAPAPAPPSEAPPKPPSSTSASVMELLGAKPPSGPSFSLALRLQEAREEARLWKERALQLENEVRPLRGAQARAETLNNELESWRQRLLTEQQRSSAREARARAEASAQAAASGRGELRAAYEKQLALLEERHQQELQSVHALLTDYSKQRMVLESDLRTEHVKVARLEEVVNVLKDSSHQRNLAQTLQAITAELNELRDDAEQVTRLRQDMVHLQAQVASQAQETEQRQQEAAAQTSREAVELIARATAAHDEAQRSLENIRRELASEKEAHDKTLQSLRAAELELVDLRTDVPERSAASSNDEVMELRRVIADLRSASAREATEWQQRLSTEQEARVRTEGVLAQMRAAVAELRAQRERDAEAARAELAREHSESEALRRELKGGAQLAPASAAKPPVQPEKAKTPPTPPVAPPPPPAPATAPSTLGGLDSGLLEAIRRPGITLRKVEAPTSEERFAVDAQDESMLAVLARALIDRRQAMKEDASAAHDGEDDAWDE